MKIYEVAPMDDGSEFHPTKAKAIEAAKFYGSEDMEVIEHEIGRLTKEVACRLASGRGFSISRRTVWKAH